MNNPFLAWRRRGSDLLKRCTGVTIYRELPHGLDVGRDLERLVPGWRPQVMFDVGANRGQSAFAFARRHPQAKVVAFEPAAANVAAIQRQHRRFPTVQVHQLALGAKTGEAWLARATHDYLHRLVSEPLSSAAAPGQAKPENGERVQMQTLDGFCAANGIEAVDFLKVDTEGHDLEVLRGAARLLREERIGVIDVEVGVGRDNDLHVPFAVMQEFLEARGFAVFGFYDQMHEWPHGRPHLRRVNLVMIAARWDRTVRHEAQPPVAWEVKGGAFRPDPRTTKDSSHPTPLPRAPKFPDANRPGRRR